MLKISCNTLGLSSRDMILYQRSIEKIMLFTYDSDYIAYKCCLFLNKRNHKILHPSFVYLLYFSQINFSNAQETKQNLQICRLVTESRKRDLKQKEL